MTSDELKRRMATMAAANAELATLRDTRQWPVIEEKLRCALALVTERDRDLLEDGRNERAVAHRLAVYLEDQFQGWHIHCEFNRQGSTNGPEDERSRKQISAEPPLLPPSEEGGVWALVDPDIIVHRRRTKLNLLVIEVKPASSAGIKRDKAKLMKYLTDEHLGYTFAVLVTYRIGADAGFEALFRVQEKPLETRSETK